MYMSNQKQRDQQSLLLVPENSKGNVPSQEELEEAYDAAIAKCMIITTTYFYSFPFFRCAFHPICAVIFI
jgi:hypothetical protein